MLARYASIFYIFGYTCCYSVPFFSLYVCSQLEEFNYTSQPTKRACSVASLTEQREVISISGRRPSRFMTHSSWEALWAFVSQLPKVSRDKTLQEKEFLCTFNCDIAHLHRMPLSLGHRLQDLIDFFRGSSWPASWLFFLKAISTSANLDALWDPWWEWGGFRGR